MTTRISPTHAALFASVDAGLFALPDEVVAARRALGRLDEATAALPPPPQHPDDLALVLANELARPDADVSVDVAALAAAERALHDHEVTVRVLGQARERAAGNLGEIVESFADDIIGNINAALQETMVEATQLRAKYAAHGGDAVSLLTAPPAARTAFHDFERGLVPKYAALRGAWGQLTVRAEVSDHHRYFAEVRNAEVVWPQIADGVMGNPPPPWHSDDPRERLELLVDLGAEVWAPTPSQWQARWAEVFGAKAEQVARGRQMLGVLRGSGGAGVWMPPPAA